MKFSDYYFCLHIGEITEKFRLKGKTLITFAPIIFWEKEKCLPDYYFSDQLIKCELLDGYVWVTCVEECMWYSNKSEDEVRTELCSYGLIENKEMTKFLSNSWKNI